MDEVPCPDSIIIFGLTDHWTDVGLAFDNDTVDPPEHIPTGWVMTGGAYVKGKLLLTFWQLASEIVTVSEPASDGVPEGVALMKGSVPDDAEVTLQPVGVLEFGPLNTHW
jgi:hypothetical protein